MKSDSEPASDEFLREGLEHVIPALRALKAFVDEIGKRIRTELDSWAVRLKDLGVFDLHDSLPYFHPEITKIDGAEAISVGVINTKSLGFICTSITRKSRRANST